MKSISKKNQNGSGFEGVDCVVDKEHIASLLAKSIGASVLLLLTDIDKVKLNYGKPNESDLDVLTVKTAEGELFRGKHETKDTGNDRFLRIWRRCCHYHIF